MPEIIVGKKSQWKHVKTVREYRKSVGSMAAIFLIADHQKMRRLKGLHGVLSIGKILHKIHVCSVKEEQILPKRKKYRKLS